MAGADADVESLYSYDTKRSSPPTTIPMAGPTLGMEGAAVATRLSRRGLLEVEAGLAEGDAGGEGEGGGEGELGGGEVRVAGREGEVGGGEEGDGGDEGGV
ncbi:uncharacterized protein L3040_006881 [Drepanopeziza brunnea f. sp. 'multigermtubi']|uniref:uncharacterized protein n=1 Tax=Drepanopeziza brunnea f. sp. 'multigermtubi' TaxID=698441 RepID=UPI00239F63E9|nr:hypothetical protein L3040_006881 [Drepanopeziza brunnea f. sp. 'multigermtubi']